MALPAQPRIHANTTHTPPPPTPTTIPHHPTPHTHPPSKHTTNHREPPPTTAPNSWPVDNPFIHQPTPPPPPPPSQQPHTHPNPPHNPTTPPPPPPAPLSTAGGTRMCRANPQPQRHYFTFKPHASFTADPSLSSPHQPLLNRALGRATPSHFPHLNQTATPHPTIPDKPSFLPPLFPLALPLPALPRKTPRKIYPE